MRATGRQVHGAVVNFVSYVMVGLPLGTVLALVVGLQATGMWIGFSVAGALQVGRIDNLGDYISLCVFCRLPVSLFCWLSQTGKGILRRYSVLTIFFSCSGMYCLQAIRNAAGHVAGAEDQREEEEEDQREEEEEEEEEGRFIRDGDLEVSEELVVSQDIEKLVTSQDVREMQDIEELVISQEMQDREELVMSQDTEKLVVSQDSGPTRPLYRSSSRCCKTKASIIISRSAFLAVGVAVLLVGAVLTGTVRPHPNSTHLMGDDENCSDCSCVPNTGNNGTTTATSNIALPHPLASIM